MALYYGKVKKVFEGKGSFEGHYSIVYTSNMDFGRTHQTWISKEEALHPETLNALLGIEEGSGPKKEIIVETRGTHIVAIEIERVPMVHRYERIAAADASDTEVRSQRNARLMSVGTKDFNPSPA